MGTILGFIILAIIAYFIKKHYGLTMTKFFEKKIAEHYQKKKKKEEKKNRY